MIRAAVIILLRIFVMLGVFALAAQVMFTYARLGIVPAGFFMLIFGLGFGIGAMALGLLILPVSEPPPAPKPLPPPWRPTEPWLRDRRDYDHG